MIENENEISDVTSEDLSVSQGADLKLNASGAAWTWDSQYLSPPEAYEQFRQINGSGDSPWTVEQSAPTPFRARFETFNSPDWMFGRSTCVSIESVRSKSDIERSSQHLLYAVYVLSGSLSVEQDGRANIAREGDLVTVDGAMPARMLNVAGDANSTASQLTLVMPKATACQIADDSFFRNKILHKNSMPTPLSALLAHMSLRVVSGSANELHLLFQAALSLLPLAGDDLGDFRMQRAFPRSFRALSAFIEDNLANPLLSADYAGRHLRCSARYVHKMFASVGTTFGTYVTERRLELARADLVSAGRETSISAVAYKWGFNDLSTFNRSFKRRFGCTPSAARL
ncbi:MAG: helix-turn-helix domain-containing protein [Hyphomicrobium sp.]